MELWILDIETYIFSALANNVGLPADQKLLRSHWMDPVVGSDITHTKLTTSARQRRGPECPQIQDKSQNWFYYNRIIYWNRIYSHWCQRYLNSKTLKSSVPFSDLLFNIAQCPALERYKYWSQIRGVSRNHGNNIKKDVHSWPHGINHVRASERKPESFFVLLPFQNSEVGKYFCRTDEEEVTTHRSHQHHSAAKTTGSSFSLTSHAPQLRPVQPVNFSG